MKTTMLICIALLFGLTMSAQNFVTGPNTQYSTYKFEQMSPDYNDPQPFTILNTNYIHDYNNPAPWSIHPMKYYRSPDGIQVVGYAQEIRYSKPPISVSDGPHYTVMSKRPTVMIY